MLKTPVPIVTTSIMAFSMLAAPIFATGSINHNLSLDSQSAFILRASEDIARSTESSQTMKYTVQRGPADSAKFAAFELFGEMRSTTQQEQELYANMLARISTPIDVDIFAL